MCQQNQCPSTEHVLWTCVCFSDLRLVCRPACNLTGRLGWGPKWFLPSGVASNGANSSASHKTLLGCGSGGGGGGPSRSGLMISGRVVEAGVGHGQDPQANCDSESPPAPAGEEISRNEFKEPEKRKSKSEIQAQMGPGPVFPPFPPVLSASCLLLACSSLPRFA